MSIMTQIINEIPKIRPVRLLCSRRRCIDRNSGDATELSMLGSSLCSKFGSVRGADIVSRMDVSLRNDDIPSISPSDGSLLSSPKLFLSRYAKNGALHSGQDRVLGLTWASHL